MDCLWNGTPTSSTFCFAELSKSLARLEAHLPGYLYASEFHKVCPQHQSSLTYTSMQISRRLTRGAKVPILSRMTTPSAYRPFPTNPVESSYTRLVLLSTSLKGPIERSKACFPKRKVYLFLFSNNLKSQRFERPREKLSQEYGNLG